MTVAPPIPDPARVRQDAATHAAVARQWLEAILRLAVDADPANHEAATEARGRLDEFTTFHTDVPFERLSAAAGLSRFEHDLLLLCWIVERWPDEFAPLLEPLQPTRPGSAVTFSLAFRLFGDEDRSALLAHRPLRRLRLIEIVQAADQGLSNAAVRADEHVAAFADGELWQDDGPRLDSMLMLYVTRLTPRAAEAFTPSHRDIAEALTAAWTTHDPGHRLVVLSGVDVTGKLDLVAAAAAASGRFAFILAARQLPTQTPDIDLLAALWKRDAALYPLVLLIDADLDDAAEAPGKRVALDRLLAQLRRAGPLAVATGDRPAGHASATLFDVRKPRRVEQRDLWAELLRPALADAAEAVAGVLAWQFDLDAHTLRRIALRHGATTEGQVPDGEASADDVRRRLWAECRSATRPVLEGLARRVDTKARLDDLVLPAAQKALLHRIAGQVRVCTRVYHDWGFADRTSRGLGIAALFAGESGTGKTMAAEALAAELELDLYRIDLSAVVSKYIGETERNLRRLFDTAEGGGAILFFDEADALFGKRSEVKDSHDRYSNIEINYLLQRMESYRGLAILATNMKSALDGAFTRRLRFIVDFPAPSEADRRRIWEKAFPPAMLGDHGAAALDFDRLARLKLVGGNIQSIVLNAAFLAAERERPLTTDLVLEVARDEYVKLGRHVIDEDFAADGAVVKPINGTARGAR